jgi:hypothetical protein
MKVSLTALSLLTFSLTAASLLATGPSNMASAATVTEGPLSGVWLPERYSPYLRRANGSAPPLLPTAAAVYEQRTMQFKKGDRSFDSAHPCLNLGQPRMNTIPYPIQIIDLPDQVVMLYEWNGFRRIDMSGKPPMVDYPVLNGGSAGRRLGDTLEITTVGLLGTSLLDTAGMPHSEQLKITERIRRIAKDRLEDRITIDDPMTFSEPWETVVAWKRLARRELREDICVDRISAGKPALETGP